MNNTKYIEKPTEWNTVFINGESCIKCSKCGYTEKFDKKAWPYCPGCGCRKKEIK